MADTPSQDRLTYEAAGVSIDAQDRALAEVKRLAKTTFVPGVLSEIGSFGGLFTLEPDNPSAPVLVASADGVGTKLKVAQMAGVHDTVGEDLVNHCVNDILVQGARPLFFLDCLAFLLYYRMKYDFQLSEMLRWNVQKYKLRHLTTQ
jgi:phosphoribosylformylglycinamidine cyclo-ligase